MDDNEPSPPDRDRTNGAMRDSIRRIPTALFDLVTSGTSAAGRRWSMRRRFRASLKTGAVQAATLAVAVACTCSPAESALTIEPADRTTLTAYVESRHLPSTARGEGPTSWLASEISWTGFPLAEHDLLVAQATEVTWGNPPRIAFYGWVSDRTRSPFSWRKEFVFETTSDRGEDIHAAVSDDHFVITGSSVGGTSSRLFSVQLPSRVGR